MPIQHLYSLNCIGYLLRNVSSLRLYSLFLKLFTNLVLLISMTSLKYCTSTYSIRHFVLIFTETVESASSSLLQTRAFRVAGPYLWNNLQNDSQNNQSMFLKLNSRLFFLNKHISSYFALDTFIFIYILINFIIQFCISPIVKVFRANI